MGSSSYSIKIFRVGMLLKILPAIETIQKFWAAHLNMFMASVVRSTCLYNVGGGAAKLYILQIYQLTLCGLSISPMTV